MKKRRGPLLNKESRTHLSRGSKVNLFFTGFFLLWLAASFFYLQFTWKESVESKASQAILIARTAANGLATNPVVKAGLPTEEKSLEYEKLKKQLAQYLEVDNTLRFAYIYILQDEELYFLADSEPKDSLDYSPPGQEYNEASDEYKKPFLTKAAVITEQVSDRWGTWKSVLIPLKNENGEVFAVFAMDYYAHAWFSSIYGSMIQSAVVAVLILLILIVFYFLIKGSAKVIESQVNYQNFFQTIDDMVIIATKGGEIFYTNESVIKKLGYSPSELRKMHVLELNPKEKRKEAERIFAEMFAGKRKSCPLPFVRKNGTYLPVETRVWFGKWDGRDCLFGMAKDLSQEQEALQKFNKIFYNNPAPTGLTEMTAERKFVDVNEAFLKKLGYSREEVIGKSENKLNLFVKPESREKIAKELAEKGVLQDIEAQVRTKSGEVIEGLFSGTIIENQGKKIALLVMIDQTEYKRDEKERLRVARDLEKLNKFMTGRELKMIELKKKIEKLKKK